VSANRSTPSDRIQFAEQVEDRRVEDDILEPKEDRNIGWTVNPDVDGAKDRFVYRRDLLVVENITARPHPAVGQPDSA
jgi:hypothetical protein